MSSLRKFTSIVSEALVCIAYKPLPDEVDPCLLFQRFKCNKKIIVVPRSKESDPKKCAEKIISEVGNKKAIIFLPGSVFDLFGGRKGRGGGWFDRFLVAVPREWIRVGVCDIDNVSEQKLSLNPWDQKMDWLIIRHGGNFQIKEARTSLKK